MPLETSDRKPTHAAPPGDCHIHVFGPRQRFLLAGGRWRVKLSAPYQLSRMPGPGYADYALQVRALVKAAAQRLLWGTNWPHPLVETKPDDADLLDSLGEWIAEEPVRRAILVEKPTQLYGFPEVV